jgi:hypothetical protein
MQYSTLDAELIDSMSQSLIRYNCLLSTDTCTNRGGGRLRGARRPGGGRRGWGSAVQAPPRLPSRARGKERPAVGGEEDAIRVGAERPAAPRRLHSRSSAGWSWLWRLTAWRQKVGWVGFFFSCAGGVGFFFCFFSSHAQVGLTKMDRLSCCTCLLCSFAHRILPRWNLLLATSEH